MAYRTRNPLLLGRGEIERIAPPMAEIVSIIEDSYRAEAEGLADVPAKIGAHPHRPNSFLHAMPAWVGRPPAMGAKLVTYYPGNYDRGIQDSTAVIFLYDPDDGQPLAIMEGMWITFVRTVACAAVAAKHLAVPNPARLGLVGCGGLGEWTLRIFTQVFPSLREIRVSSRRPESRDAFCARFAGTGPWSLAAAADAREAVEGMDIVVSSTPQQAEPRLFERWWSKGSLAIPLDYPYAWDDDAYRACDALYADGFGTLDRYEALSRAGERRPGFRLPSARYSLQDLVAGKIAGRRNAGDRILAIITGIASTDVTVAAEIFRRAKEAGLGRELTLV
jgi:alanine dehydrogenase